MSLPSSEQWQPIPGWEGYYDVSDQGRVRSVDRIVQDYDGRLRRFRSRLIKSFPNPETGRHQVRLSRDGRARTFRVAALVLSAFIGPRPAGMEACHNDGCRTRDVLTNLRYDTAGNNHRDKVRHGTHNEASKTHCPWGHAYIPENTYSRPNRNERACRACRLARHDVARAKRAGRGHDFRTWADEHYRKTLEAQSSGSSSSSSSGPRALK